MRFMLLKEVKMSQSLAGQRPEVQLPEDLDLPFFDPQLPAISRVEVLLDRRHPSVGLSPNSEADIDTNCACE